MPSVVAHACNSSMWKAEAEESLQVQSHPEQHCQTLSQNNKTKLYPILNLSFNYLQMWSTLHFVYILNFSISKGITMPGNTAYKYMHMYVDSIYNT